ncbi:23S rRNA pseudouridine1911/1915/1917 synthase [Thermonema lapsum]|uniref:23S rRNA pseudouridine1911/1915/1917 synthase n=2 Tax=Thermonema lapsum TaxID=28195 RepID=A0A846MQI2_9BACT|nr:23S rRNA pseudouridine1911/1915/1917 synthase [Thermonema lapsum]
MSMELMNKYPFSVVYEDNHLIIVNKPAGMLVQGDHTGDTPLSEYVKAYIKEKYEKPGNVFLGTIHRIDRPVSGLVMFARTSKTLERMNEMLRKHKIQKKYWAVVRQRPPKKYGRLVNWLVKDSEKNQVTVYDYPRNDAQKAETSYRIVGKLNHYYLLEVEPHTGRPHQIRAQLAHMGCPIRGDVKYGYPKPNEDQCINLHARRLYFIHPVRKTPLVCVAAVPPQAFWEEFLTLDDEKVKPEHLDFRYEG